MDFCTVHESLPKSTSGQVTHNGFHGIKGLEVFLLPHGWDASPVVHHKVNPCKH